MRGIHETRGVVRCLCSLREGERIVVISYYLLSINLVNIQICYKYPYRTAYGAYARVTFDSLTGLPIKLEANAAHGFRYDHQGVQPLASTGPKLTRSLYVPGRW